MRLAEISCVTRRKGRSRRIKDADRQVPEHDIRIQTIRRQRRDLGCGGCVRACDEGGFRMNECGRGDEDGVVVDCDECGECAQDSAGC